MCVELKRRELNSIIIKHSHYVTYQKSYILNYVNDQMKMNEKTYKIIS